MAAREPVLIPEPFPYDTVARARPLDTGPGEASADSAAEAAAREAQARRQGHDEALAESRKAFVDQLEAERSSVASAVAQFVRDRALYFQAVEGEVVQLALAIARKILHREAQIDPLLLAGIVRVALDKIDAAAGARLRVHPNHAPEWRRYLATRLDPADLPEIVEDASLAPDSCTLETAMGAADFGMEIQLKEIERGLMDLLAARPGAGS